MSKMTREQCLERAKKGQKTKANYTPEQKAARAAKASASMKKAWAKKKESERLAIGRKMNEARLAKSTPERRKAQGVKISTSLRKYLDTYAGHEHKQYIGYISSKNRKAYSAEKTERRNARQSETIKRRWADTPPWKKEAFRKKQSRITCERNEKMCFLHEYDVPRVVDYCGVLEETEMEQLYG